MKRNWNWLMMRLTCIKCLMRVSLLSVKILRSSSTIHCKSNLDYSQYLKFCGSLQSCLLISQFRPHMPHITKFVLDVYYAVYYVIKFIASSCYIHVNEPRNNLLVIVLQEMLLCYSGTWNTPIFEYIIYCNDCKTHVI